MAPDVYGLRLLGQPRVQRIALGLVAGIVLLYRLVQLAALTGQIQWGYDFSAYWGAAGSILHGGPVYGAAQLAGPYSPQQQFLYLYPPPLAASVIPLAAAFEDYRAANWLWFALGLAILVASVTAIARVESVPRGWGRWWLVAAALAFPPVIAELVLGNVHLEILGLLALAWLGLRGSERGGAGGRRWELAAGAAIGIATLVKVFPGLLLVWLLVTRRYRACVAAVVAAAAVSIVTLPVTGLQPWLEYPTVLANLGSPLDTTDTLAPTVWLAPALGFGLARVLVTVAGLALVVWLALRTPPARLAAGFGAAVTASVLIAPALYEHYLAILVLPLLLGLSAGVPLRWLVLAYLLMWGGQQPALGDLAWVVNKGLPTLGALVLLASLAWRALADASPARIASPAPVSGSG